MKISKTFAFTAYTENTIHSLTQMPFYITKL